MSIARFPSQIVIEDSDCLTELAIVTMYDSATALVEIKSAVSAACWPELSEQILGALRDMRLEGDSA